MDELVKSLLPTVLAQAQAASYFATLIVGLFALGQWREARGLRRKLDQVQAERLAEGQKALDYFKAANEERMRRREADESSSALFAQIFRILSQADPRLSASVTTQVEKCWPQIAPTQPNPEPKP